MGDNNREAVSASSDPPQTQVSPINQNAPSRGSSSRPKMTSTAPTNDIRDLVVERQQRPSPSKCSAQVKVEIISLPVELKESRQLPNTSKVAQKKTIPAKKPPTTKKKKGSPKSPEKDTPKSPKKKRIPIMTAPVDNVHICHDMNDDISLVTIPKQLRQAEPSAKRQGTKQIKSSSPKQSKGGSGKSPQKACTQKRRGAEPEQKQPAFPPIEDDIRNIVQQTKPVSASGSFNPYNATLSISPQLARNIEKASPNSEEQASSKELKHTKKGLEGQLNPRNTPQDFSQSVQQKIPKERRYTSRVKNDITNDIVSSDVVEACPSSDDNHPSKCPKVSRHSKEHSDEVDLEAGREPKTTLGQGRTTPASTKLTEERLRESQQAQGGPIPHFRHDSFTQKSQQHGGVPPVKSGELEDDFFDNLSKPPPPATVLCLVFCVFLVVAVSAPIMWKLSTALQK